MRPTTSLKNRSGCKGVLVGLVVAAALSSFCKADDAGAFEIKTGSDDAVLRWDNTLRYTLGQRVKKQNSAIINDINADDGDRNFNMGIVTNRLDVLSETDLIYKKDYGVRLSGALWYDQAYQNGLDNNSPATSNHFVNGTPSGGFNSFTKRYFAGPSGELLDAFVFGKYTIGNVPINIKVGRHTIYWGEAMLGSGGTHGISYGQSPIDVGKALAQPGIELKELFRPRNQVSVQVVPVDGLTITGQYYLQWEANRMPEPGTYLSQADFLGNGSESLLLAPGLPVRNVGDIEPRQAKDWGLAARWSPEWLEGTVGLYYRNFSDTSPQMHMSLNAVPIPGAPAPVIMPTTYNWVYPSGIDLYGISFAKQVFGISVGSEFSYRKNMPLWGDPAMILPGGALPASGETFGARGDTAHALVNFLFTPGKTLLWDSAMIMSEFTWNRMVQVTQGADLYKGRDSYTGIDHVSRDAYTGALVFTPTWFQVFPGVDLSMPTNGSIGLGGNSAVAGGGSKNSGSYGAGLAADINVKYNVTLAYTGFFGGYDTDANGVMTVPNGLGGMKDRNMVTLTMKATF